MLLKEPTVSVQTAALRSLSLRSLALDVTLDVENPNPVGISLKSLAFDLYYKEKESWEYLSHGERAGCKIKAGTNSVPVPVTVDNTALLSAIIGMLAQGEIQVRITGTAVADFYLFAHAVPFSRELTIPLTLGDLGTGTEGNRDS